MFAPPSATLTTSIEDWQDRLLAVHAATTSEGLITAVFRLMEATVQCDFSLVVLHAVDQLPMVARDSLGRVYSYEFMEQSYRHNPATAYLMQNPGVPMLTTREQLPQGDAIRSHPFYEAGMRPMNFRHCLALFFWDFAPLVAHQVFAVFRQEGRPDFDAQEEAAMLALHPHINVALKRVRAQERERTQLAPVASVAANSALLDWELRYISGQSLLSSWPAELVQAACERLREQWRAMLRIDPKGSIAKEELIEHPTEAGLVAHVSLVPPQGAELAHPSFRVRVDTPARSACEAQQRLSRLSDAEREVVGLVAAALDNQGVSDRLRISLSAVKTRLHSAFRKLGIQTRSELVKLLSADSG
jgi:DNA-binding NarL/FixJ family response regulator